MATANDRREKDCIRERLTQTAQLLSRHAVPHRVWKIESRARALSARANDRVVDLACGPGTLALWFERLLGENGLRTVQTEPLEDPRAFEGLKAHCRMQARRRRTCRNAPFLMEATLAEDAAGLHPEPVPVDGAEIGNDETLDLADREHNRLDRSRENVKPQPSS
jgi:hypothetical protein